MTIAEEPVLRRVRTTPANGSGGLDQVPRQADVRTGLAGDPVVHWQYVVDEFSGSSYVVQSAASAIPLPAVGDQATDFDALAALAETRVQDHPYYEDPPNQARDRSEIVDDLFGAQTEALADRDTDQ